MLGGRTTNKFTPMLDELVRWKDIIGEQFERYKLEQHAIRVG